MRAGNALPHKALPGQEMGRGDVVTTPARFSKLWPSPTDGVTGTSGTDYSMGSRLLPSVSAARKCSLQSWGLKSLLESVFVFFIILTENVKRLVSPFVFLFFFKYI